MYELTLTITIGPELVAAQAQQSLKALKKIKLFCNNYLTLNLSRCNKTSDPRELRWHCVGVITKMVKLGCYVGA